MMKGDDKKSIKQNSHTETQTKKPLNKGWEPEAPDANKALREEKRSLDIGGSGQFAPGGYFNQREATKTDRIDLDDYIVPPQRGSHRD